MWHFDDTDILPGYSSDHCIAMLKLKLGNCSLLKDKANLDQVNNEIQTVTEEYAAGHRDRATLLNIPKSEVEVSIPDKLVLHLTLMKIRSKTTPYASMKKKKKSTTSKRVLKKLKQNKIKQKKI